MSHVDPLQGLFTNRSAEGAARQLSIVLVWLTECQLATLEDLEGRKSSSKRELDRQREICKQAIAQLADLGVRPGVSGLRGMPCPRVDEALSALAAKAPGASR